MCVCNCVLYIYICIYIIYKIYTGVCVCVGLDKSNIIKRLYIYIQMLEVTGGFLACVLLALPF